METELIISKNFDLLQAMKFPSLLVSVLGSVLKMPLCPITLHFLLNLPAVQVRYESSNILVLLGIQILEITCFLWLYMLRRNSRKSKFLKNCNTPTCAPYFFGIWSLISCANLSFSCAHSTKFVCASNIFQESRVRMNFFRVRISAKMWQVLVFVVGCTIYFNMRQI